MAHGLGAVKEMGLNRYAERFRDEGFAVLVFDYRHFGPSQGEPRNLLDIKKQLEDWQSAVDFCRGLDDVDNSRIGLFGTSFSGGHVIVTAAKNPDVAAVVAQCPFTSGRHSALTIDPIGQLKMGPLVAADLAAAITGRDPVYVKLAGSPGQAALMNADDVVDGYLGLVPSGLDFRNEVAARVATQIPLHHPGRYARKVKSPILFCVCDNDSVAPPEPTVKYAERAENGVINRYPYGHFEIYTGAAYDHVIEDQVAFYRANLR